MVSLSKERNPMGDCSSSSPVLSADAKNSSTWSNSPYNLIASSPRRTPRGDTSGSIPQSTHRTENFGETLGAGSGGQLTLDSYVHPKNAQLGNLFSPVFSLPPGGAGPGILDRPKRKSPGLLSPGTRRLMVSANTRAPATLIPKETPSPPQTRRNSPGSNKKEKESSITEMTTIPNAQELDDSMAFDPWKFIRKITPLNEEWLSRQPALPKKTRTTHDLTLVLDLDETLVHCSVEEFDGYSLKFPMMMRDQELTIFVRIRPNMMLFLEKMASMYEVILFTASQKNLCR